jgi:hypothetical protein
MNQEIAQYVDIGARIGRGQAFGMIANQSLAAQAACLRQIRESEEYKTLDLTWEEFCQQYAGLSKRHADELIHNLEEFGAAYFRLSEIIRVSPETYRQIADKVEGEEIEIEGQMVLIAPENAPRIRTAIQRLRNQLQASKKREGVAVFSVSSLNRIINDAVSEIARASELIEDSHARVTLCGIADFAIRRLTKVREDLRR